MNTRELKAQWQKEIDHAVKIGFLIDHGTSIEITDEGMNFVNYMVGSNKQARDFIAKKIDINLGGASLVLILSEVRIFLESLQ